MMAIVMHTARKADIEESDQMEAHSFLIGVFFNLDITDNTTKKPNNQITHAINIPDKDFLKISGNQSATGSARCVPPNRNLGKIR
jgi:hypothetical protein